MLTKELGMSVLLCIRASGLANWRERWHKFWFAVWHPIHSLKPRGKFPRETVIVIFLARQNFWPRKPKKWGGRGPRRGVRPIPGFGLFRGSACRGSAAGVRPPEFGRRGRSPGSAFFVKFGHKRDYALFRKFMIFVEIWLITGSGKKAGARPARF